MTALSRLAPGLRQAALLGELTLELLEVELLVMGRNREKGAGNEGVRAVLLAIIWQD
jgi:hypothetical protein